MADNKKETCDFCGIGFEPENWASEYTVPMSTFSDKFSGTSSAYAQLTACDGCAKIIDAAREKAVLDHFHNPVEFKETEKDYVTVT